MLWGRAKVMWSVMIDARFRKEISWILQIVSLTEKARCERERLTCEYAVLEHWAWWVNGTNEESERISPGGNSKDFTEYANLIRVLGTVQKDIDFLYSQQKILLLPKLRSVAEGTFESILTISNEYIEETRGIEVLKFSRVFPQTSHCQDKD